jgi:hypothetical protein
VKQVPLGREVPGDTACAERGRQHEERCFVDFHGVPFPCEPADILTAGTERRGREKRRPAPERAKDRGRRNPGIRASGSLSQEESSFAGRPDLVVETRAS